MTHTALGASPRQSLGHAIALVAALGWTAATPCPAAAQPQPGPPPGDEASDEIAVPEPSEPAEPAEPEPAAPAASTPVEPAAPPPPVAPPPEPPPPAEHARRGPEIDFTGLVQVRYQVVRRDAYGEGEPTFSIPRARAQIEVDPMDHLRLTLEAELTSTKPIRDAMVRYRFDRALQVTAGHFKRPFGAYELDSSWTVLTSERGIISDRLHAANLAGRDVGVMLSGRVKQALHLEWAVGAFNGEGGEPIEDGAARLSISPGPLTVGGAFVYSRGREISTTGEAVTYDAGLREAWALEGDVSLELPFLFARFEVTSAVNRERAHEGHFGHMLGLHGIAVGRIRWRHVRFEPGVRVERYDSSVKYGKDALIQISPLVRTSIGKHLQILLEGNVILADDFLQPLFHPAERRFVLQVGGRT